jgi:RNA polymerase sigma factor (sigma-70 family)
MNANTRSSSRRASLCRSRAARNQQLFGLLQCSGARCQQSFTGLYHLTYPDVARVCQSAESSPADVEEAVQDVYLALWERCSQGTPPIALASAWFARFVCGRAGAAQATLPARRTDCSTPMGIGDVTGPSPDPELVTSEADTIKTLHHLLARLPHRHREMINMVFYHDLSAAEICCRTGMTRRRVVDRRRRALTALRVLLDDADFLKRQILTDGLRSRRREQHR